MSHETNHSFISTTLTFAYRIILALWTLDICLSGWNVDLLMAVGWIVAVVVGVVWECVRLYLRGGGAVGWEGGRERARGRERERQKGRHMRYIV
jgi:hypothetical protein